MAHYHPSKLFVEEQLDKASETKKNEPIHSGSTNSGNVPSDRKLPKDLPSPNENDKNISDLSKEIGRLSLDPSRRTKFVISTIAYVPEHALSSDSSCEERDSEFSDEDFNTESIFPFTTKLQKYVRKKKKVNFIEKTNPNQEDSKSTVMAPLLQKLSKNGFEENDKDKLTTSISASIALNRMRSLSTRKNKSLNLELESKVETGIRYEKFGFFWKCRWYDKKTGNSVPYKTVKKYYKQLKKIAHKKAEKFREMEERNVDVPYQSLREHAKHHNKTKKLIKEADCNANNVYLSLIDSDTVDFNGIYSAYLRIVQNHNIPTVMSTGYEYPTNDEDGVVYQFASQIDRNIRVITARHIQLGVYYPEPNTCVLIQRGCDTLEESFIDEKKSKGNLESACLLKKVQSRENATFIFSDDKPLITALPDRAKLTRSSKSTMRFSPEFVQGASPTRKDVKSCKQVAQSSFHKYVWLANLFINGTIHVNKVVKYPLQHCKHLISKISNSKEALTDMNNYILELKKIINSDDVDAIINADKEVMQYITRVEIDNVRSASEQKLLDILKEGNIKITEFSIDARIMLAEERILELLDENIINLHDLIKIDIEALECICYDDEIIISLKKKTIDFDSLLNLLNDNCSDFMKAKEEYSILDILNSYAENPLHLKFMSGDPSDIVLENADDEEIVRFGIRNYDIDTDYIRCELNKGREYQDFDCAAVMDWDRIISDEGGEEFSSDYDNETCYEESLELEEYHE